MVKEYNSNEGFASNGDVRIFYKDYGPIHNEPILLIHGLGAQLVHWPPHLINFLSANGFRPIVFDNRDIGLSTRFKGSPKFILDYIKYFLRLPIASEYRIDDMALDALCLLDHLKIEKAHILSTSMGGMIAQVLASDNPSRVNSLTLIASTASTPHPLNAPSKNVRKVMLERSRHSNPTFDEFYQREITFVKLIGRKDLVVDTPEFKQLTKDNFERAKDGSGYGRQLLAILASKNRLQKVKKINSPTLIIHGKDDPMIHLRNAVKMQMLIPHSKLEIIEHMRHLIDPESLDEIAGPLLRHLRKYS